jgi:hypothetical protein
MYIILDTAAIDFGHLKCPIFAPFQKQSQDNFRFINVQLIQ